ncbi:MAG: ferritin-like domain-containing protein [Bacteroidetes bacterium]|jgi:rubrerythrin|nr:ferritin-like domain-containing protein [Bacteroidota bacterium]
MSDTNKNLLDKTTRKGLSRKKFLKYAGTSAATVFAFGLAACEDDNPMDMDDDQDEMVNLGSGDAGILNYAYALEQLEAAFYIAVLDSAYSGMSAEEGQILEDLRDHEVAHRDWFQTAISSVAPNAIIPGLTPDFSSVDFSDRGSVLATAQAFEDLGVSAYNGAGQLIENTDYLVQAGKIVSVEARHASAIRSLIGNSNTSFAGDDIIDGNGLELTRTPNEVLGMAQNFITEQIDGSNLPQPQ